MSFTFDKVKDLTFVFIPEIYESVMVSVSCKGR